MKHMRRGKVLHRKTRLLSFFTVLRLHNPPAFPIRFWWSVLLGIVKVSICWVMLHPFGFSFCFSRFWVWDFKFMLFSFYTIFSTELVNSGTYNHHEIQNIIDLMENLLLARSSPQILMLPVCFSSWIWSYNIDYLGSTLMNNHHLLYIFSFPKS